MSYFGRLEFFSLQETKKNVIIIKNLVSDCTWRSIISASIYITMCNDITLRVTMKFVSSLDFRTTFFIFIPNQLDKLVQCDSDKPLIHYIDEFISIDNFTLEKQQNLYLTFLDLVFCKQNLVSYLDLSQSLDSIHYFSPYHRRHLGD